MPGGVHFLDPFCYRCPFGQNAESCHRECISHLEEVINRRGTRQDRGDHHGRRGRLKWHHCPDRMIIGPVYARSVTKYGILLISDEVMSGWGRTGKWFAVDNWDVIPDIITTAKGITSGYAPLGAVIVSEKIAKFFDDKYLYAGLHY